jgi:hypothetical protein
VNSYQPVRISHRDDDLADLPHLTDVPHDTLDVVSLLDAGMAGSRSMTVLVSSVPGSGVRAGRWP